MQPTPVQRLLAAIPPVLLIGFVIAIVGEAANGAYVAHLVGQRDHDPGGWERANLIGSMLWVTSTTMIALGLHEVARRVWIVERAAVQAAAILMWLVVARAVASIYVEYVATLERDTMRTYYLWGSRLSFVAWLGVAVLLAVALRRRAPRIVVALAVALVVTAVLASPLRTVRDWVYFDSRAPSDWWRNNVLSFVYGVAHGLAILLAVFELCRRDPPLPGDPLRVAEGLTRVGTALVARVVIAMGFVFAMLLALVAKSPGLAKLALVLSPVAALFATVAMITGMFQAGGNAGAPAPPRYRFALAGAFTLASLVVISIQAIAAYHLIAPRSKGDYRIDHEPMQVIVAAFPYLGPAIALAGLLFLISALASLRAQRGPVLGSADPGTAAALVISCSIGAVAVQRWAAGDGGHVGTYLVMLVVMSVASIVAQLAVARLCHKVADGLVVDSPTHLPTARVHDPL